MQPLGFLFTNSNSGSTPAGKILQRDGLFTLNHSIEKETVCSSAIDGGFQLDTFDDVIKYNTGKSLLCFLKIGGNHEVQLLAAAATRCSIPVVYN